MHARTLEQLDARGLADDLLATGSTITRLRLFRRLSLDLTTLPSRFPFLLITPQYEVERLLERRARRLGVRFRYETELLALRQDADGVDIDVRTGDGTTTPTVPGTSSAPTATAAPCVRRSASPSPASPSSLPSSSRTSASPRSPRASSPSTAWATSSR